MAGLLPAATFLAEKCLGFLKIGGGGGCLRLISVVLGSGQLHPLAGGRWGQPPPIMPAAARYSHPYLTPTQLWNQDTFKPPKCSILTPKCGALSPQNAAGFKAPPKMLGVGCVLSPHPKSARGFKLSPKIPGCF